MLKKCIYAGTFIVLLCFGQNVWQETTQGDFADGTFERNIYASRREGGTVEFAPRFDLNNDGYIDIITCDIGGPYVRLLWGSASGYSTGNSIVFPSTGAGDCDIADLNQDGYADLIVSHANYDSRIAIYWGSGSGPSPANVFNIMNAQDTPNEVIYAADLNKDGYLDIITGTYNSMYVGAIFWGTVYGYSPDIRTNLPTQYGGHNAEVADLNEDGWLDIIFVNDWGTHNWIYWGSATGYETSNMASLAAPQPTPHGASVADLNDDGHLDLVFTSVYGQESYLYYREGYGYSSPQVLNTGSTYGGSAVCDIDEDGYLDIVFFRGWPTALKPVIYWGSLTGYSDANKSEIGAPLYGDGGFVADLNQDGYHDILVNSRGPYSSIFWGPLYATSTDLPVDQDHHGLFREIGNVHDRAYLEDYRSSVFDAGDVVGWSTIEWDAATPSGTSVLFWVRSGNVPGPDSTWSDWQPVTNGGSIPYGLNARYLQYRARLGYTNPCYLPALYEVTVTFGSAAVLGASVKIKPETINLQSNGRFTAFITLPADYDHHDIDGSTLCCNGADAVAGHATPDFFIAKFNVEDLIGVIPGPAVPFTVTGQLFDCTEFAGCDSVRVIGVPCADAACYPNPFSTETTISAVRAGSGDVRITIYDISGKVVRTFERSQQNDGVYSVQWDRTDNGGQKVCAGVYFYHVEGTGSISKQKIIVID